MDVFRRLALLFIALAFSLATGCAPAPDSSTPIHQPVGREPVRYPSATHAVISTPTSNATAIPIPTATPSTYIVAAGDTLGTIAEQFGLQLRDIQAANPGVVSESLSIGQTLKIPAEPAGASGISLPTPAPAQVGEAKCYPSGAGYYCLAPVYNPFPEPLENVKLQITVVDQSGQPITSLEAFPPLDVLPPGSALPAYAYFPALELGAMPLAQLATSIRLLPGDGRYFPAAARNVLVTVGWDGRSARAQGQVFLLSEAKTAAGTVRLVAVAYDAQGEMVGFRRWESTRRLRPDGSQPFDVSIYSLGPAIEKVEIVVEARP